MIGVDLSEIGGAWSVERISLTTTAGKTIQRLRGTDWTARAGVECLAAVLAVLKLRNPNGDSHSLNARLSPAESKLGKQFQKLWNAANNSGSPHWTVNVFDGFPSEGGHNTSPMERFLRLHGSAKNLQVALLGIQGEELSFRLDGREMSADELQRFLKNRFNFEFGPERADIVPTATDEAAAAAEGPTPENDGQLRSLHAAPEIRSPATPLPPDIQVDVAKIRKQLDEIRRQPKNRETYARELHLLRTLARILTGYNGYAAREVQETYAAIRRIWQQVHDPEEYFPAVWAICTYHLIRGELREAAEAAQQQLTHAQGNASLEAEVRSHNVLLATNFYQGNIAVAMRHFEEGLTAYGDRGPQSQFVDPYDADSNIAWFVYAAWVLWAKGRIARATEYADVAIELTRGHDTPIGSAHALYFAARVHHFCGAHERAQALALQTMQLAQEAQWPVWWGGAAVVYGDSRSVEGHHKEGLRFIGDGIEAWRRIGARISMPFFLIVKARALARAGQLQRASETVESALTAIRDTGCGLHESEALSLRAELLYKRSPSKNQEAEAIYRQAIDCAKTQGAHSLELRARLAFSRYLFSCDASEQVSPLLSDGLALFREGEESQDILEARKLLHSL